MDVLKSRAANHGLCIHKATRATDRDGNKFVKKVFFYPSGVPYKSRSHINFVRFVRRRSGCYTLSTAKDIQHILDIWAEVLPPNSTKAKVTKRSRSRVKKKGAPENKRRKQKAAKSVSKSDTIESESIAEKTDAVATGTNDITAIESVPTITTVEMPGRETTSPRTKTLTTGVKKSVQPQPEKTTDTTTVIVANKTNPPDTSACRQ